jgi:hypothetical protein
MTTEKRVGAMLSFEMIQHDRFINVMGNFTDLTKTKEVEVMLLSTLSEPNSKVEKKSFSRSKRSTNKESKSKNVKKVLIILLLLLSECLCVGFELWKSVSFYICC